MSMVGKWHSHCLNSTVDIVQLFSVLHTGKVCAEGVSPLKCPLEDSALKASSTVVTSKEILGENLWLIVVLTA